MAAGIATLRTLLANDGAAYEALEALSSRLENGIGEVMERLGVEWSVVRVGSILWLSLQAGDPPRRYEDISPEAAETFAALHRALLERGVMLAPSAYEVMFVSLAHDTDAIAHTVEAFEDAVKAIM
jgi:glutamate-1-semialdehyde 2,1-aminomutase